MGKAVPRIIKFRANQLIGLFENDFTPEFDKNKEFVKTLELPLAKSTINKITGQITKIKKKEANWFFLIQKSFWIFFF